ncbi:hypothetical protein BDQ17DRAFT_687036 [Cyathus striatus]|nr:hypothetical protein BDQ17DRAFT_687036 [Cyathus striatus]
MHDSRRFLSSLPHSYTLLLLSVSPPCFAPSPHNIDDRCKMSMSLRTKHHTYNLHEPLRLRFRISSLPVFVSLSSFLLPTYTKMPETRPRQEPQPKIHPPLSNTFRPIRIDFVRQKYVPGSFHELWLPKTIYDPAGVLRAEDLESLR